MKHSPSETSHRPMKMGVIKQFLGDVEWGELDYLIVDCPPGTGDEPLSICQLIENPDGAVIVTTPQRVAAVDVRKSLTFCKKLDVPVLGILENMSGFSCPNAAKPLKFSARAAGKRWPRILTSPSSVRFPSTPPLLPRATAASPSSSSMKTPKPPS